MTDQPAHIEGQESLFPVTAIVVCAFCGATLAEPTMGERVAVSCHCRVTEDREGKRHRDGPATERVAAKRATPRTGTMRGTILRLLYDRDMTDRELARAMGYQLRPWVPATRRGELTDDGYVERTGEERPTETDTPADVHRLTAKGRDWVEQR